jgi:hypothetical protein
MTLGQKQRKFTKMVALLILYAYELGYELTFGEAWRPSAQAQLNAKEKRGIKLSLHGDRLAIDFNLFKNGKWLTKTEDHRRLGEFWESIGGTWGGRFDDGNHYSLEHGGRK